MPQLTRARGGTLGPSTAVILAMLLVALSQGESVYPGVFAESGRPAGSGWSSVVSGISPTARNSELSFSDADGGYDHAVAVVAKYTVSPEQGIATAKGGLVAVHVTFVPLSKSSSGTRILGLPPLEGWALIGGIAVVVVLILIWMFLRMRRRSPTEDMFDSSGRPVR